MSIRPNDQHPADPVLAGLSARLRTVRVVGATAIAVSFIWLVSSVVAWFDGRRFTPPTPQPTVKASATARLDQREVDWSAFEAPIWNPRPAPQIAAPPPPPPPLRLKLLAIVGSPNQTIGTDSPPSGQRSAMIYDPDTDEVVSVREGERISGRVVKIIDSHRVVLLDGAAERVLELDDAQSMVPRSSVFGAGVGGCS